MNRHDIHLLQQIRGYPCLTITLPTHRTSPQNRQDPVRMKNLMTEATNRLLAEFTKREAEPILSRLEGVSSTIDFNHTLDGLALFVNQDFSRSFQLPFVLNERVVIDETFATRDLVFALNRTPRYWVLALSEQPTRLFAGVRESLTEVQGKGFPMTHTGPGGETALPGGIGVQQAAYRDERHRQFFRQVDAALKSLTADEPLPIAVVGVDRYLAFFNELTSHQNDIITTMTGNHDKTSVDELGKLIWPLVEVNLADKQRRALSELDKAVDEQKYVSTVGEVWRLAHEGRGRLLVVEEGFHFSARVDQTGRHLTPAEDTTAPDVIDDAVDEIIETVLSKQGQVVFVDNGALAVHQHIALILRY